MPHYIYAYDPIIKRRVVHVIKSQWAISMITNHKFRYNKMKTYNKIEEMPEKELKKLIKETYNKPLTLIKPIPYVGEIPQIVQYKYDELIARCPMTGLQDTYFVTIQFTPDKWLPELKSLKYYFLDYDQMRISHEHIHAKIYKDFKKAVRPKSLQIHLDVAVRGGIKTDIIY